MGYTLEPPDETSPQVPIRELIRKLEKSKSDSVSPYRGPKAPGARGIYQIEPDTARRLGFDPARLSDDKYAEKVMNAAVADLASRYPGDAKAILVGYNASPKVLDRWLASGRDNSVLPTETRDYLERADRIQSGEGGPAKGGGYTLEPPDKPPVPKPAVEKPAPPKPPSALADMAGPLADLPKDIGHQFMEGARANQDLHDHPGFAEKYIPGVAGAEMVINAANQLASPLTGAAEALLGRPIAKVADAVNDKLHLLPGQEADPEAIGNAASMAIPALGELREANTLKTAAKAAGVSERALAANREAGGGLPKAPKSLTPNTLKTQLANRDPTYGARVERLHRQGVDLTPGQIKGGEAKIAEQQNTSSRYQGEAIRNAHQGALESYNRAGYNEALAPIGERYDPKGPVGRDAIDNIARRIGAVYDRILPQAKLKRDPETAERISEIREDNEELLGPYKGAFDSILKSRVIKRLDPDGGMVGRSFKAVESELSMLSRRYHQSQDGAQHILGDAIDDLNGALRDNMERNSPPAIRAQLRQANTAWAVYKRLEGASERRPTSMGVFTPGDLQQTAKVGNRGGSFARGNALMSQFADDGQAVLGNVVPDSGTAGRINRTRAGVGGTIAGEMVGSALGHGPIGGAAGALLGGMADRSIGGVTNTLAAHLLRREASAAVGRATTPRNYLKAAEQRSLAHRTPMLAGPSAQIGDQQ